MIFTAAFTLSLEVYDLAVAVRDMRCSDLNTKSSYSGTKPEQLAL